MLRELPWPVWLAIGLTLLIAGGAWSLAQMSRRRDVWRRFARRKGLGYSEPTPGRPVLSGAIDGHPVKLALADSGSDQGGVVVTVFSLGVPGLPAALQVHQGGLTGAAEKLIEGTIATGDAEFDRIAVVHAADPEDARTFLTPARRAAIRELFARNVNDRAGLEDGDLFIESRQIGARIEGLEAQLAALLRTARALEGAS